MKIQNRGNGNIHIDMEFQLGKYIAIKQHEDENGSFSVGPDYIVHVNSKLFNVTLTTIDSKSDSKLLPNHQWHGVFENYLFQQLRNHGQLREFMHMILEAKYNLGLQNGKIVIQSQLKGLLGL